MGNLMKVATAMCVVLLAIIPAAQGAMIDAFDSGSLAFVPAGSTGESQVAGLMLGGERDESITNSSASGGVLAGASGGAYSYGAISATGSVLLVWDGGDADPALDATGLGGLDLTEGGSQSAFSIGIESNDFVAPLVLTVYSSVSDFSQITIMTPGGIPSGPAQTLVIPFADLIPSGSGADFGSVGAISLMIDGASEPQLDITLGSFSTSAVAVPEASTFAQLALGLVALARHSRRRRRLAGSRC